MNKQRPIILGIVGDSAVGKSTITDGLVNILGPERVSHFCTDDYHKYYRKERAELGISALHPDCNYLDILQLHMERMHYGQPILKPIYDHSTGTLTRPEYLRPNEFVIVEGLLGFSTPALQQFFDVKVYLDPPEELRYVWKIGRDTVKRGYTREEVLSSLKKRESDTLNYIRPQRKDSDIVVSFVPPEGVSPEDAGPNLNVKLVLRPTIPHPDLSYLFDDESGAVRMKMERQDGLPADVLEIDGNVTTEQALRLEDAIWQHLPDLRPVKENLFGNYQDGIKDFHSHPLALTQLLITYHLLRKYKDIAQLPFAPPIAALSRLGSVPVTRPVADS
jgi:phosphoribulokinase